MGLYFPTVDYDRIVFQLDHSASIRMFRSASASLALGFFHFAFKLQNRLQIPYSQLKELFQKFKETLDESVQSEYSQPAQYYLDRWSDDQHRFLRKYYEKDQDEPITELTYDAERALEWLQSLEKKEFVGTQSRFLSIFENMKKMVEDTQEDVASRLLFLKNEKKKLDDEAKKIQTTGVIERMDATQIRERFLNLLEDSRRLISDFRLVEDIFKDLTRSLKEQKLKESVSKGDILRQILDAHDYLEESDQGKSFMAFWNFLTSEQSQGQLKELSEKILKIPEIQQFVIQNQDRQMPQILLKLKGQLLQVGQKVLKSKFRLSEELRKLLHQRTLAENQRVLEVLLEIKRLALENRSFFLTSTSPRSQHDFLALEQLDKIQQPLLRPLWKPSQETRFQHHVVNKQTQDKDGGENWKFLFESKPVLESDLEKRIEVCLKNQKEVSLPRVLQQFPLQQGLEEVVAYVAIAAKGSHHRVHLNSSETVTFQNLERAGRVRVPQIVYVRSP